MNLSPDNQTLIITANRAPKRSQNVYHMLVFEWVLMAYYLYLFMSIVTSGAPFQLRIIIYSLVFLLFEKLELTYKYLELEDPLHLLPFTRCIRLATYLCLFNLLVLMVRILIDNQNMHAFLISMHLLLIFIFFISELSKKNTKLDMNIDQNSVFSKMVTPSALFIFSRTSQSTSSQFWFVEVLFFLANLYLSLELERILLLKECQYIGWQSQQQNGKSKGSWNRLRGLRGIIVFCCILIVTQNLLMIPQKMKYQMSVTIWHTFIVAISSYLLYSGYIPFKK